MNTLDRTSARTLIDKLKSGTSPIEFVEHLNVGNERWYAGAVDHFNNISDSGDTLVRFVRGHYGDGKTHFLGMLRNLAFKNGWSVSYVTAVKTELHKFDAVYSQVIKAILLPPDIVILPWLTHPNPRGAMALLAALFSKIYSEVYGGTDEGGINKRSVLHEVQQRVAKFSASSGFHDLVSTALMNFTKAALAQEAEGMAHMISWFQGDDVKFRDKGISKRIDKHLATDALRCLTQISQHIGVRGTLVLLDEAELIMAQTKVVRAKCYSVIRDLLDNADPHAGMRASIIYVAATPEMFISKEGFAEYEALRSRLLPALTFTSKNFIDYRDVVVDLSRTQLKATDLLELAKKVRSVHSIARDWDASSRVPNDLLGNIVSRIDNGSFPVSRPRMVASVVAKVLEAAEQNPDEAPISALDNTLSETAQSLATRPEPEKWS